jgi:phage portal protein BeeE
MRSATVFACVKVLAESIGSVPCKLYRRLPGGGKEVAREHPLPVLLDGDIGKD